MARSVRDIAMETRTARARLAIRKEPYWRGLDAGVALGYRRNKSGGVWLARRWVADRESYREHRIGLSDDVQDADGTVVFSFRDAQEKARRWWLDEERRARGLGGVEGRPYSVNEALSDYFAARERKGTKGLASDRAYAEARIVPELGFVALSELTAAHIRRWHEELADKPKLVKTKAGASIRATRAVEAEDSDARRARRATANRVLTVLKAALNRAFQEGRVTSDEAWRRVRPFRSVDAPVIRFLTSVEANRLIDECQPDIRKLAQAALVTGCRYGELIRLTVGDVDTARGSLIVRESKAGKPRHVALAPEAVGLFSSWICGRPASGLVFIRSDNRPWKKSDQARPLAAACARAGINPAVTFHILRHTHASMLAMQGVGMAVIAQQLGHSDTRMTERHYAHLCPSYVADAVKAGLPAFGFS